MIIKIKYYVLEIRESTVLSSKESKQFSPHRQIKVENLLELHNERKA